MTDKTKRILLVDDEESITDFVGYALRKEGFAVDIAANGTEAFEQSTKSPYDLYILDIMLPGIDGYELCRRIRAHTQAPILFLSARDKELDKVIGLEIGGDDYLTKPYELDILGARIDALLRRANSTLPETGVYAVGDLRFDLVQSRATMNGVDLNLSGKEFGVLLYLCRNRQHLVSREALYRAVWGQTDMDSGSILWTTISRLKKKIAPYEAQLSLDSSHEGYELYIAGGNQ